MTKQLTDPGFQSTYNRGVHIRFSNGYLISVQWGGGNYSSRRTENPTSDLRADMRQGIGTASRTAEVLIERPNGQPLPIYGDDGNGCVGWQTPEQVAELMKVASADDPVLAAELYAVLLRAEQLRRAATPAVSFEPCLDGEFEPCLDGGDSHMCTSPDDDGNVTCVNCRKTFKEAN